MSNNDTNSAVLNSQAGVATKDFDDLLFTDDFIFCKTLENNQDLFKELAEMIIGRKISEVVQVDEQKEPPTKISKNHISCLYVKINPLRAKSFISSHSGTSACRILLLNWGMRRKRYS